MSAPRKIWLPVPLTDEGPCYVDKDEAEFQWGCASTAYHHDDVVRELMEALEEIAGSADDGDGWTSYGHERRSETAAAALAKIAQEG